MKPRIEFWKVAPGASKAMSSLEAYLHGCDLDLSLLHMVKLRASQMNGCAYCIDMHWKDARDAAYEAVRGHFSDKELADLTWAVAAINAWNRVSIALRSIAGSYRPPAHV